MGEDKVSPKMASTPFHLGEIESSTDKLTRKAKEAPFVPIGLAGLLGVVSYGAYKYKYRGAMSTSVFLMQLRVAAQGTVVACLTLGLVYSMTKKYVLNNEDEKK